MDRVIVTRPMLGILFMQVCACKDADDEEILRAANEQNPCGTSQGWAHVWRSEDGARETEQERRATLPVPCADAPDRMHYLINC